VNLPNKISVFRVYLVFIILIALLFPFHTLNVSIGTFYVYGQGIPYNYLVAGIIFVIGSISDFLDGYIARKYDLVTTFGKFIDPVSDKLLVNTTLIALTANGFISPIIVIVMVGRDIMVDAIRMIASQEGSVISANVFGKLKTIFQMIAITIVLFHNVPFEGYNVPVDEIFVLLATLFSVISGYNYFRLNKDAIFKSL
jgi:CDP-diacylglycerol--glycerol-3-phosphate 3-phosphatidyltransferase